MATGAQGGSTQLVEREREVGSLHGLLGEALAGTGRLVLIEGPAGIGKTRLLGEVRAAAEAEGVVTLTARGSELEREFGFGVVRQLFEARVAGAAEREQAFAGAAAPARTIFEDLPEQDPGDASFAALHGLFWLLLNLAQERPLVLAVDDLHWCDRGSLRFLAYLVRRLEGVPILIATTLRSSEPGTDPALLADIAHDPATASVRPGAFSDAGTAAVVRERLGPKAEDAFCAACHRASGGNPLLLRQLLSALEAAGVAPLAAELDAVRDVGPRAVSRTVLLRLARLSQDAVTVARAVAILGEGAALPAVAELTGLDVGRVAEASGALARAEILRAASPLGFVHPLVREAVYHDLAPAERELQHARAAQMLIASGAESDRIAAHLLTIAPNGQGWVVDHLQEAGRAAVRRGAADSAVAYLRRAIEEPPLPERRPRLLFELGLTEALVDGHASVEHLREAYETLTDPTAKAIAAFRLTHMLVFTGPAIHAARFAQQAARAMPDDLEDVRLGIEAIELATVFFGAARSEALARLEAHRGAEVGPGPGARMLAAVTALDWAVSGGAADECTALALRALEGDTLIKADNNFLTATANNVVVLADRDEALEVWDRAEAEAHRRGSLFAISGVHLWKGFNLLRRGDLAEAERLLLASRDDLRLWGDYAVGKTYSSAIHAAILIERGRLEDARAALGEPLPGELGDSAHLWMRAQSELLLALGRNEEALESSVAQEDRIGGRTTNPAWVPWRSLRAIALDRLGRGDEALELVHAELAHARAWGAPGTVGRTLRILGTLERAEGIDRLREAVAVLEGSSAQLELAKALGSLGAALRRVREPTEAREPLRRALELADVCGAAGLAEEVRRELYATGARPRTTAMSGAGALTASERRVAELAAAGQSNRDIAQTLFVTPKTVEVHLTSSYRKLGIRSRRELAGALAA